MFVTKTRSEWMKLFRDRDVCVAPVKDFAEAFSDEQVLAREMVVEADIEGAGSWRFVGNPIKLAAAKGDVLRYPPPRMGEHNQQVLDELGIGSEEAARLRAAGAF